MQCLIKFVDGTESTVHIDHVKTEKNVATFKVASTPYNDEESSIPYDRNAHLDNISFYRTFEKLSDTEQEKRFVAKMKNGTDERVNDVLNFYASGFYLVVESSNCITYFPLKNVLFYDIID